MSAAMGDTRFTSALQVAVVVAMNQAAGIRTTSSSLAEGLNTNASFVRKIVAVLVKARLLTTSDGSHGGVRLSRPAALINLLEIHEAIVPEAKAWAVRENLSKTDAISAAIGNVSEEVGSRADKAVANILFSTSLQDCVDQIAELERRSE